MLAIGTKALGDAMAYKFDGGSGFEALMVGVIGLAVIEIGVTLLTPPQGMALRHAFSRFSDVLAALP